MQLTDFRATFASSLERGILRDFAVGIADGLSVEDAAIRASRAFAFRMADAGEDFDTSKAIAFRTVAHHVATFVARLATAE